MSSELAGKEPINVYKNLIPKEFFHDKYQERAIDTRRSDAAGRFEMPRSTPSVVFDSIGVAKEVERLSLLGDLTRFLDRREAGMVERAVEAIRASFDDSANVRMSSTSTAAFPMTFDGYLSDAEQRAHDQDRARFPNTVSGNVAGFIALGDALKQMLADSQANLPAEPTIPRVQDTRIVGEI